MSEQPPETPKIDWKKVKDDLVHLIIGLPFLFAIPCLVVFEAARKSDSGILEIIFWGFSLVIYPGSLVSLWSIVKEVRPHRIMYRCAWVFALLLTTPVFVVVLLLAFLVVAFLWEKLNSLSSEVWLMCFFVGFLLWQNRLASAHKRELLAIKDTLTEIKESVGSLKRSW
jgi:predicted neutral ceramidase superfamily lipid hydrolase